MYKVNLLLYARGDSGWKFQRVRKTLRRKFVWDNPEQGVYYLEWYEDGKRRRARAGIRAAEVLEAQRRKILELKGSAVERGRKVNPLLGEEENPVPLTATTEAYLNHVKINQKLNTYRRYRSVLGSFRYYFSSKKYLNEISRGDILEFRDFRAGKVASPVTLNSEITMIRAFLYWCVEFRGLKENPASKIKPRQVLEKRPEVYSDEELTSMLEKADPVELAILFTCCYTGMREQEICFLEWPDLDFKKKLLRVSAKPELGFTPKTWEEREIEMSDRLVEVLKNLPRNSRWVFPTVRGKRHAHIYKIVERVAERVKVSGAHPHKFRATFLTRLLQSGCDIRNVQTLAGHKSIKTTQRYLGVSTELRRQAVNRLNFADVLPAKSSQSLDLPMSRKSVGTPS